jgi:uncharacterized membrane protein
MTLMIFPGLGVRKLTAMPADFKPPKTQRFDAVDALRGFAMVWMTVFHFCFDLNHFGYWRQNFLVDPFWSGQRTAILSLFLFTAGLGQAVAVHQGQSWHRFWRRWAQVAVCALMVSAGSYLMYPSTFIYFGVLHGMAVMLIVVRLTAGWGRWLWWLGLLAIAVSFAINILANYSMITWGTAELFNSKTLNWLGFVTRKPATEDFVPLLPWLGVMWWGMAAGNWILQRRVEWLSMLPSRGNSVVKALTAMGRWSLSYYILHQPVMIGTLMAAGWLTK